MSGFADLYFKLGESKGSENETVSDGGIRNRLVMLVLLVMVTLGVFWAACLNLGGPAICYTLGAIDLPGALALAIMAKQATLL